MVTKHIEAAQNIYQLKITLLGTKPPIWRRLQVSADLTLAKLHRVLQVAMGWDDQHMHEFRAGQRLFGRPGPRSSPFFMDGPQMESERTVRLDGVLERVGARMIYTYDMGDSWEHVIVLEKQLPAQPDTTYPVCTDGKLACPPEDCGGIPGYYDVCDALADPGHPRYDEVSDWIGEDYDPEAFLIDTVNRRLFPARRRGKTVAR